jgi:hypothetical protein
MQRWEYLIAVYGVTVGHRRDKTRGWSIPEVERMTLGDGLNALGGQGWELVSIEQAGQTDNMYLYFKRPTAEPADRGIATTSETNLE